MRQLDDATYQTISYFACAVIVPVFFHRACSPMRSTLWILRWHSNGFPAFSQRFLTTLMLSQGLPRSEISAPLNISTCVPDCSASSEFATFSHALSHWVNSPMKSKARCSSNPQSSSQDSVPTQSRWYPRESNCVLKCTPCHCVAEDGADISEKFNKQAWQTSLH